MENKSLAPRHTSLIEISEFNPVELFKPGGSAEMLERIKKLAFEKLPKADTVKGRKEIVSRAARVSTTKTVIDGMRVGQVEEMTKIVAGYNKEGKYIRDCLSYLKVEVRQSATEYEDVQKAVKAEKKLEKEYTEAWDIAHEKNALINEQRAIDKEKEQIAHDKRLAEEVKKLIRPMKRIL